MNLLKAVLTIVIFDSCIALADRVRGPYCQLRTAFLTLEFTARVGSTKAMN